MCQLTDASQPVEQAAPLFPLQRRENSARHGAHFQVTQLATLAGAQEVTSAR